MENGRGEKKVSDRCRGQGQGAGGRDTDEDKERNSERDRDRVMYRDRIVVFYVTSHATYLT